jgi:diazepam-binding inhibitor (GABA receptor modulator, acyl-CoA-binding protein)
VSHVRRRRRRKGTCSHMHIHPMSLSTHPHQHTHTHTHNRKTPSFDDKKKMLLDLKSASGELKPDVTEDPELQSLLRETSKHGFESVEELSILTKDDLREAQTSLKPEQISPMHRKIQKIVVTRSIEEEDSKNHSYPSLRPTSNNDSNDISPPPSPPSAIPPVMKRDSDIKMRNSMCMSNTSFEELIQQSGGVDKGEWSVHVAGYLSKLRSSILSDSKSPRKNAMSGFGAWQRRFFELPSAPCRYLRYFKSRSFYKRTVDNPKPDCAIDLSQVHDVKLRDDRVTLDLSFKDGGVYTIRAEDGGTSDASRWHTALSSRVSWLRTRKKSSKKETKDSNVEKTILLNVSSKEDDTKVDEVVVVDPYVDSMTNKERNYVKELKILLKDLLESEAKKRREDVDDSVVVPGDGEDEDEKAEEEEEEEEEEEDNSLETHFLEASQHIQTNKSLELTNDQKGQIYGLYKQAREGDVTSSRPSMFDPVGRAKWDAWKKCESLTSDDAKLKYLDLVKRLSRSFKPSVVEKKKKKKSASKKKSTGKRPDQLVGILDIHEDYRLLKYIRAKSGNVKSAEGFVRRAVQYREAFNIKHILTSGMYVRHPILKYYSQGGHPPWGIDRDGGPVRYERIGRIDPKLLKHVPDKLDLLLFEMWKSESMELSIRNICTPTRKYRGVTVVQDLRGLGFGHMNGDLLAMTKLIAFLLDQYYPENLKRAIVIHAPYVLFSLNSCLLLILHIINSHT